MNQTAIDFIAAHEGCQLTAYQDGGGVWSVGYGTTGPTISKGLVWTQQQADDHLTADVNKMETAVLKLLNKKLSDQSMAALISLCYNIGPNALATSHLIGCVNDGDFIGATKAFLSWDHIGQDESKGLLLRRLDESALFLRGV